MESPSDFDLIDNIEKILIKKPFVRTKKLNLIHSFKAIFSEFFELYTRLVDITASLRASRDNSATAMMSLLHKLVDLADFSQKWISSEDDELINELKPSELNDLFSIVPRIEEAKYSLIFACNLSDFVTQTSLNSPNDIDKIMYKGLDNASDSLEKRKNEIEQGLMEYISALSSAESPDTNSGSDCSCKHEKSISLNKKEENKISSIVSGNERKSSEDFDFSYLPGKRASLSENYKSLISRYFNEFSLWGTKRIKIGHPFTSSPIHKWYGRGFSIDGVMLSCDDSMVRDDYGGISGLIINDKRFECTCLPGSTCNAELCTLKSIDEKNGVISLNDGQFRFDFVMLNDDEYYFIYHLFERIVAFNKQNNVTFESNYQYDKCDFINKRMNMSLGRRFTSEVHDRIFSGNNFDDILIYSTKSPERWNRALSYICPGEKSENVYLVMDDTIFQSCKAGLVMTDSSLWLRPAFSSVHERIYLKDIKSVNVERKTFIINGIRYEFNLDKPVCPMSSVLHNIADVNNKKLIPYTARKGLLPPDTKYWYGEK